MELILASGSPRRKELLELAGYHFSVMISQADEEVSDLPPDKLVEELSARKAREVAQRLCDKVKRQGDKQSDQLVLGADTVVACDGRVLGKPADPEEALAMLRLLSGQTHQVYTGVTLIRVRDGAIMERRTFCECSHVTMRSMDQTEIEEYIATGEPFDKAGGYGIQGKAAVFVSSVNGDYYNVVGLPLCRTVTQIREMERNMK